MKKKIFLLLLILPVLMFAQVSIYDIQYTEDPGDGTYPSPLDGQDVTVGGIVTAIGYYGEEYFISSSTGGAWNGIFIYDNEHSPSVGDSIIIQGTVYEYYGLTEIMNLTSYELITTNNPLPLPLQISTFDVFNEEAYESVLIEINDVTVTQDYDSWGEWQVNDSSGDCIINNGFLDLQVLNFPLIMNYPFSYIRGVISYSWGNYYLHPRGFDDLQSGIDAYILSIASLYIFNNEEFEVPVTLSFLGQSEQVLSYQFLLQYNSSILEFTGFELEGTLSESGVISDLSEEGNVQIEFEGEFSFSGIETLINLKFLPLSSGDSELDFDSALLNDIEVQYFSSELIFIQTESVPIGDTLTIIQRPILNIPTIAIPGQEMDITCIAPENTTGWEVELLHEDKIIPLNIIQNSYDTDLQRWNLQVLIPILEIYELYDLKVTALEDIDDISKNAVQIIPEIKNSYYFIHITDTHLPTHYFYPDPATLTDTSEVDDFREVIKDINLINPEFVLLTGDLVNEGELEDFENRRVFTKAQKLMTEFEVPVYLVSGNHDLGGWYYTPPPQGTARHNWWRFFGWKWLQNPPAAEPFYTQDYSFDYGPVHYVGMEAYINYDGYMYDIYSGESFIPSQLEWLENNLANATESESKVLFYHMDFSDQIDLSELNVDMALWGHIHQNSGSIYTHPYNLATNNVCDGERAYRLIRVDDSQLQPENTISSGGNGENLTITFYPSNDGTVDSILAVIDNQQNLDLYLPANSTINVSITSEPAVSSQNIEISPRLVLHQNYPNPFNPITTISFQFSNEQNQQNEQTKLEIYNVKGQKVKTFDVTLLAKPNPAGAGEGWSGVEGCQGTVNWNGKDDSGKSVSSGIYFYKLCLHPDSSGKAGNFQKIKKMILMK
jgi:predicted phosphodiesterase